MTSALQERSGSSPAAIKKYLTSKGKTVDSPLLGRELKKLVAKGYLVKVLSKKNPFSFFTSFRTIYGLKNAALPAKKPKLLILTRRSYLTRVFAAGQGFLQTERVCQKSPTEAQEEACEEGHKA